MFAGQVTSTGPLPLPVVALFLLMGAGLVALGLRDGVRAYRLWRTTAVPIGELGAASGRVLVTGVARRAERTVEAPLTGADCLAYAWRITGRKVVVGFGDARPTGYEIGRGRDAVPFVVEDDTGRVRVEPGEDVGLQLAEELVLDPVTRHPPTEGWRSALGELDLPGEIASLEDYFEGRLDEGETVVVQGVVRREEGPLRAGEVAVRIGGSGTLVADARPRSAARRRLRSAVVSVGAGLAVLLVLVVVVLAA